MASAKLPSLSMGLPDPPHQPELLDFNERVEAKEAVVLEALASLDKIYSKLCGNDIKTGVFDANHWLQGLCKLQRDHDTFEYLVGIGGQTGLGKTSVLNALLGKGDDLAPSSQNGACTAAVCCFRYGATPEDPAERYSARILFKSKDTVDNELRSFFSEYKENEEIPESELDREARAERERLGKQLNLISRWSGLDQAKILEMGQDDSFLNITRKCVGGRQKFDLDSPDRQKSQTIKAPTAPAFLRRIKEYVGGIVRGDKILVWPIVEMVDIYLDMPILRHGVVLVDLPGEMDALESRSRVAKQFYNKLDRLMVVTPSDRACDNSTADDLIRDDQVVDMEADGNIEDAIAVIVTKTDLMFWESFVENEWSPEEISDTFPDNMDLFYSKRDELKSLVERIEDLKEQYPNEFRDSAGSGNRTITRRNRKPTSSVTDLEPPANLREKILMMRTRQAQLDDEVTRLNEICFRACIQARSRDITTKLREMFYKRRVDLFRTEGTEKTMDSDQLTVIHVSSHAHRKLLKGEPLLGFNDPSATGFEDLERWISEGSLPKRDQHADAMLERCKSLFDAIEGWTGDQMLVNTTLPEADFPLIKEALSKNAEPLAKALTAIGNNTKAMIRRHVKNIEHSAGNRKSSEDFVEHVDGYEYTPSGEKLHWATYGACIRRHGGAFKSSARPPVTHCWEDRLYSYYWKPHAVKWWQIFNPDLDKSFSKVFGNQHHQVFKNHIQSVLSSNINQAYKDLFNCHLYRIEGVSDSLHSNIKLAVSEFKAQVRAARMGTKLTINENMVEGYQQARLITGKKKKIRQAWAMHEHAELVKESLFFSVIETMKSEVNTAQSELGQKITKHIKKAITQINRHEGQIAKIVCRKNPPKKASGFDHIGVIRDRIQLDVDEWRRICQAFREKVPSAQSMSWAHVPKTEPDENPINIKEDPESGVDAPKIKDDEEDDVQLSRLIKLKREVPEQDDRKPAKVPKLEPSET